MTLRVAKGFRVGFGSSRSTRQQRFPGSAYSALAAVEDPDLEAESFHLDREEDVEVAAALSRLMLRKPSRPRWTPGMVLTQEGHLERQEPVRCSSTTPATPTTQNDRQPWTNCWHCRRARTRERAVYLLQHDGLRARRGEEGQARCADRSRRGRSSTPRAALLDHGGRRSRG